MLLVVFYQLEKFERANHQVHAVLPQIRGELRHGMRAVDAYWIIVHDESIRDQWLVLFLFMLETCLLWLMLLMMMHGKGRVLILAPSHAFHVPMRIRLIREPASYDWNSRSIMAVASGRMI